MGRNPGLEAAVLKLGPCHLPSWLQIGPSSFGGGAPSVCSTFALGIVYFLHVSVPVSVCRAYKGHDVF